MSILLSENINRELVCYAKELLLWFVRSSVNVYGNIFTVYNVHGLIHLADDVINHGCSLNNISAFKFENYMQSLKKMVRNSNNPIAQVVKRLSEKRSSSLSAKHSKLFKENGKDTFFISTDGDLCEIKKILHDEKYECDTVETSLLEPFYDKPINSKRLGIYFVRNRNCLHKNTKIICHSKVEKKLLMLPYKNGQIFFSLLHSIEGNKF